MTAQSFLQQRGLPVDFVKEPRIGDYGRLREIRWLVKGQARAREICAPCGLDYAHG